MATTNVTILVKTAGTRDLDALQKKLGATEAKLQKASKETKKFELGLGSLAGKIAAVTGVAIGLGAAFDKIVGFDKASTALNTLGVDSKKLTADLRELSKDLNGAVSVSELTGAAFAVASAGFKDAADNAKILEAAAISSKAKFADLGIVANATTSVLNSYGLSAESAGKLNDKFFQTIKDGVLTIEEYSAGIGRVASVSAAAGVSIEEINASLATATAKGVGASEAFTGISAAIKNIIAPSKGASDLAAELGIQFNEAALKQKGFNGVLKDVAKATGGSVEQLNGLFTSIEAVNTILPIINGNFEQFDKKLKNQKESAGAAQKAFDEAAKSLASSITRIQNSFDSLVTSFGPDVIGVAIPLFDAINASIQALDTPLGSAVLKFLALAAAVYALNKALVVLKGLGIVQWFGRLIPLIAAGKGALVAMTIKTKLLTKAQLALNAAMSASPWVLLAGALVYVGKGAIDAKTKVDSLGESLRDTTGTGEQLKEKMQATADKIAKLKGQLDGAGPSADYLRKKIELLTAALNRMKGRYEIEILLTGNSDLSGLTTKGYKNTAGGLTYTVSGVEYNAATGLPVKKKKEEGGNGNGNGGGGDGSGSGSKGAAPKTDDLESLKGRIALLQQIAPIQDKINIAILNGDELTAARLEGEKAVLEQMASGEDALRRMNTEAGKQYQTTINRLELDEQLRANALAVEQTNERLLEQEEQRKEALQDTLQPIQDEITLLRAKLNGNEDEIKQLIEIRDLKRQISENGGDPSQAAAYVKQRDELAKQVEAADKLEAQYKSLAESIASSLTGAFRSVVTGAKSAEQALSDAFKGIADAFLDMAMKMIQEWMAMQALGLVKSLFGGGPSSGATPLVDALAGQGSAFTPGGTMPFFGSQQPSMLATGGTANGGQPYIVGEQGPELFIPGVTGMVSNNDQFEAARDAMGGSSSGSSEAFAENSDSISTTNSYIRERSMERDNQISEGGAGSMVIETQVINDVEYATVEQVRLASAASAKQARAQVFSDMKNKPSRRAMVGLK